MNSSLWLDLSGPQLVLPRWSWASWRSVGLQVALLEGLEMPSAGALEASEELLEVAWPCFRREMVEEEDIKLYCNIYIYLYYSMGSYIYYE